MNPVSAATTYPQLTTIDLSPTVQPPNTSLNKSTLYSFAAPKNALISVAANSSSNQKIKEVSISLLSKNTNSLTEEIQKTLQNQIKELRVSSKELNEEYNVLFAELEDLIEEGNLEAVKTLCLENSGLTNHDDLMDTIFSIIDKDKLVNTLKLLSEFTVKDWNKLPKHLASIHQCDDKNESVALFCLESIRDGKLNARKLFIALINKAHHDDKLCPNQRYLLRILMDIANITVDEALTWLDTPISEKLKPAFLDLFRITKYEFNKKTSINIPLKKISKSKINVTRLANIAEESKINLISIYSINDRIAKNLPERIKVKELREIFKENPALTGYSPEVPRNLIRGLLLYNPDFLPLFYEFNVVFLREVPKIIAEVLSINEYDTPLRRVAMILELIAEGKLNGKKLLKEVTNRPFCEIENNSNTFSYSEMQEILIHKLMAAFKISNDDVLNKIEIEPTHNLALAVSDLLDIPVSDLLKKSPFSNYKPSIIN